MFRKCSTRISVLLLLITSHQASLAAETIPTEQHTQPIEEVVVFGVRERLYQSGMLKDAIQKTEVVDQELIRLRQAVNLSQAIAASPGVRVSNECSMCGVKRIMLNGMRGEHTTILTDGLPLHTMLAGYYAVDAIATTGLERIEVARGAGASLTAPEAIGGTINVISETPTETAIEIDAAIEEDDGYLFSGYGTWVSNDGRHRASLVTQLDSHDKFDGDDNGVGEAPLQDNRNIIARLVTDLSERDSLTVRAAFIDSEIFGGPTAFDDIDDVLETFDGIESAQLFVNDDVRLQYIGKPWETTEWIDTERTELSFSWLHEFSADFNTTLGVAYSKHDQDSFYEGFDYAAEDKLTYVDLRSNYAINDQHLLTFGIDQRDEEMRSDSVAGELSPDYIEDSFDYKVQGLYVQDTWSASENLELSLALRIDNVEADFVAPEKPGTEIDETIVAPRIDARYEHNDTWSSRFSAGLGYRSPLSFFETDHGILDAGDGFAIDVDDLETSKAVTYALSYEGEQLTLTFSVAHTEVDDLAAMDETPTGVPLLTQLDESASVTTTDVAWGYKFDNGLTLGGTLEKFNYDDAFEGSYAIAPVEERITLSADYSQGPWSAYMNVIWIGSRDLGTYGYEGYNVLGSDQMKSLNAESYLTVDMRVSREFSENVSAYIGAYNLFDENQGGNMESPLFWDPDGGYDVAYIYGPLRGREIYAGIELRF